MSHVSVLLHESVDALLRSSGTIFVDATLGGGGHTAEILSRRKDIKLYAFDLDEERLAEARTRFAVEIADGRLILIHGNYGDIRERLKEVGVNAVDGILIDAGVSSFQIDQAERGFSFAKNGPLDMRMDQSQPFSAYNLVNEWPQEDLEKIFFKYGEERFSRKIAGRIVERRSSEPIADTATLSNIIRGAVPRDPKGIHPATRVFQAIRIVVNKELESIEKVLQEIPSLLNPGGVFAAISFHSLEDRPIKERLKFLTAACICPPTIMTCPRCNKPEGELVQRKPIIPTDEEISQNPRARSAKLRVFLKNT